MKTIILKHKDISSSMRIDGSYHLSDAVLYEKAVKKNYKPLSQYCSAIFTAGRNKRMYTKKEYGYPYLSNSDVISQNAFENCKYNSIKHGYDENAFLKEGMILTGRVGAIAQTAYVTKEFENKQAMGSDNIIRIITKNQKQSGFIYAFLSSKIGKAFLWKLATGGVQPYITENMVANIPVPIFPGDKQEEIHSLIVQAAELRVEANRLLEEAVALFESFLPEINTHNIYTVSRGALSRNSLRLEASTNFSIIQKFYNQLEDKYKLEAISDLSESVFTPGIFKRIRVENAKTGIPFLSGSDLLDARPSFNSFLSKKMKNINDYILKKGWIAIQDAGTIGYISLINGYLDNISATNNLVRIIPYQVKNANPYIFTFLKTKQGQKILKSLEYGSVQKHIDNNQVSNIKIPILPAYTEISRKVNDYLDKITEACLHESHAIQLVEKEIDQWQQ